MKTHLKPLACHHFVRLFLFFAHYSTPPAYLERCFGIHKMGN